MTTNESEVVGDDVLRRRAVIVDVDGTLCEYSSDRINRARFAIPRQDVIDLIYALWLHGYTPLFVSARPAEQKLDTCLWIKRNVAFLTDLPLSLIEEWTWLRPEPIDDEGFWISDVAWKRDLYLETLYPRYDVRLVLDDLPRCVAAWRELGLTTLDVGTRKEDGE